MQIGAWTVGGASVDLIKGGWGAINDTSIDLNGWAAGTLSQTFDVIAGTSYLLTFQHYLNGSTDMSVMVSDANETHANQTYSHWYPQQYGVMTESLSWTATTTGTATLTFAGSGGDASGATLDNVMLTQVPEPSGIALSLAALGAIGFVRRRNGKSKA